LSERQVSGNAQDDRIWQSISLCIELAYGHGACRCIDARKNIENLALSWKIGQRYVFEILVDQREHWGGLSPLWKVAFNLNRYAATSNSFAHKIPLNSYEKPIYRSSEVFAICNYSRADGNCTARLACRAIVFLLV
jgi:hypothetical protein